MNRYNFKTKRQQSWRQYWEHVYLTEDLSKEHVQNHSKSVLRQRIQFFKWAKDLFFFFFLIFYLFIYFYIYFWLRWVFVSVRGLPPAAASGGHSSSQCAGLFTIAASPVAEHRLQTRRLSNCGPRAQLLRGMWDPPRPGLESVSPALAGRLPTTAPPGKPKTYSLSKKK